MNNSKSIIIIYGSETGTSEYYAYRIYSILIKYFNISICNNDNLDEFNNIKKFDYIIYLISTTGQGIEPNNFRKLWKFLLQTKLTLFSYFKNVKFFILGLGDSSYSKYNFAAKRLYRRMIQLGAESILPLTLADEQHMNGIEYVINEWIESICKYFGDTISQKIDPCKHIDIYEIRLNESNINIINDESLSLMLNVVINERGTDYSHFQDVRLLSFHNFNNIKYEPGDILVIVPKNSDQVVSTFVELFKHIDRNCTFNVYHLNNIKLNNVTFEYVCQNYFDLNNSPRQYFFTLLYKFASSIQEKERILQLSLSENVDDFQSYTSRPRRNYLEIFTDFPSTIANISLKDLFHLIPSLTTREYSICSSYFKNNSIISIIVARVNYQTSIKKPRIGVCSDYLCNSIIGQPINCHIKQGTLKFPSENIPLILISTGTGCATIHAYLSKLSNKCNSIPHLVFLGFRYSKKDLLFEKSWYEFKENLNINIYYAFSRDDSNTKIYVQDLIKKEGESVINSIFNGACIYVFGNAKRMPDDVYSSFKFILQKYGSMNENEASTFLHKMELNGRYQTETY